MRLYGNEIAVTLFTNIMADASFFQGHRFARLLLISNGYRDARACVRARARVCVYQCTGITEEAANSIFRV
jgi:hypothetical protein